MKNLISIGSVVVGSIALNLIPVQHAQAVGLVNGDFNTNNVAAGTSGFLGGGRRVATATGWDFGTGLNWLVSTGTAYTDNLNIKQGRPDPTQKLYGTAPIDSPNGTASWFVAADGDPTYRSAITQTLSGLVAGEQYEVSFWQAAGQQTNFTGGTTEQWQVSLGGAASQLSTVMSPVQPYGPGEQVIGQPENTATAVSAWQQQTLTFTADSANPVVSFLAVGTPSGMPPISLLTGVSVTRKLPEPADYMGTLVGFGFVGLAIKSRLAKKKLNE
jgi:hypothetical protein